MTSSAPDPLQLASTSRAGDAGYLAAVDLAAVADGLAADYRLLGGNAVTLLTAHFEVADRVPARETADADFGAGHDVIGDARLPEALRALGYTATSGNRFTRTDTSGGEPIELAVDVLAPTTEGRLVSNQPFGLLVVDAVPGLSFALARPAVDVQIRVVLSDGRQLLASLRLPEPVAALCLKSYAYAGRLEERDAMDVWRLLEVASAAGVRAPNWPAGPTPREAGGLLHRWFGRIGSAGPADASPDPAVQARIRALLTQVVRPS